MTTDNETYYPSKPPSTKWEDDAEQEGNSCTSFIWLRDFYPESQVPQKPVQVKEQVKQDMEQRTGPK